MAIKKSELYRSLWSSCDELRGGMDASQYKDYVLFMLFIKYISDKYGDSDDFAPPVNIPAGASFRDMIALKGKSDIGDRINTQVIQPLIDANARLEVARAYAVSKLGWIRDQQVKLREQAREPPRQFVTRESHYLWGKRYLLSVAERE